MVKCRECGLEFKRISNSHLKNCCGLTMAEYALKYNIPIHELVDFGECAKHIVTEEEKQAGVEKTRNTIVQKQDEKLGGLTEEEEQIIIGGLLGDAYIKNGKENPFSSYFIMTQGIRQLNYLLWKGARLKRLEAKFYQYYRYNSVVKRFTTKNDVRTCSWPLFGDLAKQFYNEEGKILSKDLLYKLKPLGIAIWYMDDGSYNAGICFIATHCFKKGEVIEIIKYFKEVHNIAFKMLEDNKNHFFIRTVCREESEKFISLIKPYIYPDLKYKIGEESPNSLIVSKKLSFDAAHFLTDHPAKCNNLHGGRYDVWVSVKGAMQPDTGMVIDYTYLKSITTKYIIDKLDHNLINGAVPELAWRSTTELLCVWMWLTLIEFFPNLYEICVYETPDSYSKYQGPSLDDLKYRRDDYTKELEFFQRFNNTTDRVIMDIPWEISVGDKEEIV